MRLRDRLRQMMIGRYGRDQLNNFLSILCLVFLILNIFIRIRFRTGIFFYLALATLVLLYYRTFSRNYAKRAAENQKFLYIKEAFFGNFSRKKNEVKDRDHAYFKCPNCKKRLRVPKGKGRISIHCPQCGTDFIKTT